jgi:hypothetical protein
MKFGNLICSVATLLLCNLAQGQILFEDRTDSSGLGDFHDLGYGTAMLDYDHDGLLDIFVVGQGGQNRLFKNVGNMRFQDITNVVAIQGSGSGWGVCFGDFDSDNDEDIYISRRDNLKNDLFVFENGTFHERALSFHVDDPQGYGYSACFAPLTKDLALDLIVANQAWPNGQHQSCRFFAGNIGAPFTDVTLLSGIADSSQYWDCVSTSDYDNDGNLDLLVSAESQNRLYHNNGNGFFTNLSDSAGINMPPTGDTTGYGIAWGDYNNDGWMDVYISCWHDQHGRLFRNNGNGTFTDVTQVSGVGLEIWSHSVSFGDFDNDGWLDLYSVSAGYGNRLYKNNEGNSFSEIGQQAGVRDNHWGCGLSVGDIDRDGRIDMVVGHYANGGDNPSKVSFYHNITDNTNNWIEIKVNGFPPNPDAIGARVRIVAGGITQIREVSGGSGFGSQNMLPLHFGLGAAGSIDSLIIYFPVAHIPPIVYVDLIPNAYYELPDVILDVASVAIISPNSPLDCEQPIIPVLTITNVGNVDATDFKALYELSYDSSLIMVDSLRVSYLAVGDSMVLDFAPYILPQCKQEYHIEGIVRLLGDQCNSNDTAISDFYATYAHDISCGPILNPEPDTLLIPFDPEVVLNNLGINTEINFPTSCMIFLGDSLVYLAEGTCNEPLSPDASDSIRFMEFLPPASGMYRFSFNVSLQNDRDISNDSVSTQLEIFLGNCSYILGDINGNGVVNGLDIVYGINYFKGGNPPPYTCQCGSLGLIYIAGDINASCSFNGIDITDMVNFFGGFSDLYPCPFCPPLGFRVLRKK